MPLEGASSVDRSLVAELHAPSAARRELEGLADQLEEDLLERSLLVVTELVTNSIRHAGLARTQRVGLRVSVLAELVRIEVADQGPGFAPVAAEPGRDQRSGWGLWLVDQLADRWGVDRAHRTRVWCELDRPGRRGRRGPRPMAVAPPSTASRSLARRKNVELADRGELDEREPGRHDAERGPHLLDLVRALLAEGTGTTTDRRARREAPTRRRGKAGGSRPLEFDEGGFPIPQTTPGFVERVARLLDPG
jgi:anti-sigma regulatory factor (Ser/Thr protein kinase)